MIAKPRLIGQVSSAVTDVVQGPRQRVQVVASTRSAIYLATVDAAQPVLSVITADAVRVPNAVVLPSPASYRSTWPSDPKTTALVGAGAVEVGALTVVAGSTWTPPRASLRDVGTGVAGVGELCRLIDGMAQPVPPVLMAPMSQLHAGLRTGDRDAVRRAAHQLVGLGPGLTPSGDDLICGVLATGHALACTHRDLGRTCTSLAMEARRNAHRTPVVSAALMRHAAQGEVIPELSALLHALGTGDDLRGSLSRLLAVGHHSGSDLARGVALSLLAAQPPTTQEGRDVP
jgi:Protein of unknown function (DUF2877)